MSHFDWENLDDFLSVEEFATAATITKQGGGVLTVRGIFDAPYLNAQLGEYELDSSAPRFMCKAADVVGVTRGDEIVVDGVAYHILTNPQGDGTGLATLQLGELHQ